MLTNKASGQRQYPVIHPPGIFKNGHFSKSSERFIIIAGDDIDLYPNDLFRAWTGVKNNSTRKGDNLNSVMTRQRQSCFLRYQVLDAFIKTSLKRGGRITVYKRLKIKYCCVWNKHRVCVAFLCCNLTLGWENLFM